MNRRKFMTTVWPLSMLGPAILCPSKIQASKQEVPFLPTLEWLQEHNPDIVFYADYRTLGPTWTAYAFRKSSPKTKLEDANFVWENGKWVTVKLKAIEEDSTWVYDKIPWPSWLRKF